MSTRRQLQKRGSLRSSFTTAANPLKPRGFGQGIPARAAALPKTNLLQTRPFGSPIPASTRQRDTRSIEAQKSGAERFGYNGLDVPVNAPGASLPGKRQEGGQENGYQPFVHAQTIQRQQVSQESIGEEQKEPSQVRTVQQQPGLTANLSIQRDDTESLPEVPAYQLTPPSLGQSPNPASGYSFGQDFQLHLDPQIQAMAMQQIQQQINPATLLPALSQINLAQLTGLGQTAAPAPNPFAAPSLPSASPLVPRGAGPQEPRAAEASDLMDAILAVPAIETAITNLKTQATEQLMGDWGRLNTGEQVGVVSTLAVIGGGALTGVLSDPNARQFSLSQLNGRVLPVPGLDGLHLEMNTGGDNLMVGMHVDVGALLPPSLGFGSSSPKAMGSPPISSSSEGTIQRSCDECSSQLSENEEQLPVQAKLTVGQPGDKYEQEADSVAVQVVEQINAPSPEPSVQPQLEFGGVSGEETVVTQELSPGQTGRIQRDCGENMSCPEEPNMTVAAPEAADAQNDGASSQEEFDTLMATLANDSLENDARRTAAVQLANWCREHLPNRDLLNAYLNSPTQTEATTVATAEERMAAAQAQLSLLEQEVSVCLPPEEEAELSAQAYDASAEIHQALADIENAHSAAAQEKTQTVGELAVEVARMEFLLGWMYEGGVSDADNGGWENQGSNRGEFVDYYHEQMGTAQGQAWCTRFAGYAHSQVGFNFDQQHSFNQSRSIFHSGYRLRHWAKTGKSNAGNQLTPEGQRVIDPGNTSALIDSGDWRSLRRQLRGEDDVQARQQFVQQFFQDRPVPQAGDILVVGGTNNSFSTWSDGSGGHSHTTLVERYDAQNQIIYTVEGNRGGAVRGEQVDLTDPNQVAEIVFIARLGFEYFTDNNQDNHQSEQSQGAMSQEAGISIEDGQSSMEGSPLAETAPPPVNNLTPSVSAADVLNSIRQVNARLADVSSNQGWIESSNAQGTAYEWMHGTGNQETGSQSNHGTQ